MAPRRLIGLNRFGPILPLDTNASGTTQTENTTRYYIILEVLDAILAPRNHVSAAGRVESRRDWAHFHGQTTHRNTITPAFSVTLKLDMAHTRLFIASRWV